MPEAAAGTIGTWIGVIGLFIAFLSYRHTLKARRAAEAELKRQREREQAGPHLDMKVSYQEPWYVVTVVNSSDFAATLTELFWSVEKPRNWITARPYRFAYESFRSWNVTPELQGPAIPHRLDGLDQATWSTKSSGIDLRHATYKQGVRRVTCKANYIGRSGVRTLSVKIWRASPVRRALFTLGSFVTGLGIVHLVLSIPFTDAATISSSILVLLASLVIGIALSASFSFTEPEPRFALAADLPSYLWLIAIVGNVVTFLGQWTLIMFWRLVFRIAGRSAIQQAPARR